MYTMPSDKTSCSSNWDYHNSLSFPELSIHHPLCSQSKFSDAYSTLKTATLIVFPLLNTLDSSQFHSGMASNGLKGPTQPDPIVSDPISSHFPLVQSITANLASLHFLGTRQVLSEGFWIACLSGLLSPAISTWLTNSLLSHELFHKCPLLPDTHPQHPP